MKDLIENSKMALFMNECIQAQESVNNHAHNFREFEILLIPSRTKLTFVDSNELVSHLS